MKLVGNNKKSQQEKKSSIDREELAGKKDRNAENQLGTNIESLIREKNINQKRNTDLLEKEKAKTECTIIRKVVLSNLCFYNYANKESKTSAVMSKV